MRNLSKALESLKKSRVIGNYEITTFEKEASNNRAECIFSIKINNVEIITKTKLFNKEVQKFSHISDTLTKEVEDSLLGAGIMALYSNRVELNA